MEGLCEHYVPLENVKDPTLKLFVDIWNSQPPLDHIEANKRLKSQGMIKRMADVFGAMSRQKGADSSVNNVFAPTAAL